MRSVFAADAGVAAAHRDVWHGKLAADTM